MDLTAIFPGPRHGVLDGVGPVLDRLVRGGKRRGVRGEPDGGISTGRAGFLRFHVVIPRIPIGPAGRMAGCRNAPRPDWNYTE